MGTGESLSAPEGVRRLQKALHEKAKESPDLRFYSLSDKVWRADVLQAAWQAVRRNGGAAGVDGETVQRIEARGVNRWLGELARDLKEGQVSPAYKIVDAHAIRRLRRWLCRKHKVRTGKYVRFPDERLWEDLGLIRLVSRTASFPWAKA